MRALSWLFSKAPAAAAVDEAAGHGVIYKVPLRLPASAG